MRRRDFLARTTQAVVGFPLLSVAGRAVLNSDARASAADQNTRVASLVSHLERQIPSWMQEAAVPGLGICIISNAHVAWQRGFGVRDRDSKAPVKADTMFEAASMSKPVFAYVVMKLCETGVMNLDTPLTRYGAAPFLQGDSRIELITARRVLSHTSGFQNWRSEKDPLSIHFTPGERFMYSGEGYNYLQTVATHVLGQEFETYMKARLLVPFGMRSSGYLWQDTVAKRMARPHDAHGSGMENKKSDAAAVARYGSSGALLTTPADYAKFVIEVINPKPADRFRLNRESLAEMLRPQVKIEGGQYPASWALGWQVFHNTNRDFIYHGGDNDGFHCAAVASVAGQSGFVMMTNGEGGTSVLKHLIADETMQAFLASEP